MRGSTAAGIYVLRLPRDCSCEGFPDAHLLVVLFGEETSFGVCWISGSAVWGRDLFPSICGEFADGAILEEASFPGFFGIRLIRYRIGPPVVRNMRAVLKKASYGTRRVFGSPPCSKQASTVRE